MWLRAATASWMATVAATLAFASALLFVAAEVLASSACNFPGILSLAWALGPGLAALGLLVLAVALGGMAVVDATAALVVLLPLPLPVVVLVSAAVALPPLALLDPTTGAVSVAVGVIGSVPALWDAVGRTWGADRPTLGSILPPGRFHGLVVVRDVPAFRAIWQSHRARATAIGDPALLATACAVLAALDREPPGRVAAALVGSRRVAWVDLERRELLGVSEPRWVYLAGWDRST